MNRALVVLSGGQDSTTCLYWAMQRFDEVHAITFDYGQRHRIEVEAARRIAGLAGIASHEVIAIPDVLRSSSPLLNPAAGLETYSNFEEMDGIIGSRIELTFVPLRNAFFLTLAANIAHSKGCGTLVTGVCQEDNANYPDCRATFVEAQQDALNMAMGAKTFDIAAPLMSMSKSESILLAQSLPGCMEAIALSHTCYAGTTPPCGECHSCVLRAHGFAEAGVADPALERAHG